MSLRSSGGRENEFEGMACEAVAFEASPTSRAIQRDGQIAKNSTGSVLHGDGDVILSGYGRITRGIGGGDRAA